MSCEIATFNPHTILYEDVYATIEELRAHSKTNNKKRRHGVGGQKKRYLDPVTYLG